MIYLKKRTDDERRFQAEQQKKLEFEERNWQREHKIESKNVRRW